MKADRTEMKGRMRRWQRKAKPVIFAGCVMLTLLLLLGGTQAWFTSADFVRNPVKREEPAQEFIVVEVDEFDPEPDDGLYEKRVGAQNVGDVAAFVRLLVLPVFQNEDGDLLPAVLGKQGDPGVNVIVTDFNLAEWDVPLSAWKNGDWADGGDGYYYYLNRLNPGTSTEALNKDLFKHLRLVDPAPAGYENAQLIVEVKCEAVEVNDYRDGWWGLTANTAPSNPPFSDTIVRIDGRLQSQMS